MQIDRVSFDEADLVGLVSDARGVVPALVERAEAEAVGLKNEEIHQPHLVRGHAQRRPEASQRRGRSVSLSTPRGTDTGQLMSYLLG